MALALLFNFAGPEASQISGEGRYSGHQPDQPLRTYASRSGATSPHGPDACSKAPSRSPCPSWPALIAPTVVGSQEKVKDTDTGLTVVVRKPIASQVAMAVRRAIEVRRAAVEGESRQKVAIVFYNYPPGKANIGASYLNVAESIVNILDRLAKEGYDVGQADLSARPRAQGPHEKRATSAATRPAS